MQFMDLHKGPVENWCNIDINNADMQPTGQKCSPTDPLVHEKINTAGVGGWG